MTALSPDPTMLSRRARDLVHAGRMSAARPLIAALRRIAPDGDDAAELEARVLHFDGHQADAEALLSRAIAGAPDSIALLLCRAELRLQNGEFLGGADDAAAAVISSRHHAPAKALLGVALIELGRFDEAVLCLREAVAASPRQPNFREAYAQALERSGERDAAMATLEEGIALAPGSVSLRIAAIMTATRRRDHATAARFAESARKAGVADARVFGLLGHSRSLLGEDAAAAQAYEEALKLAPEDRHVRYLVAASRVLPSAPRAPADHIRTVFDGYADCFDAHLASLGYRVPGLMRALLLEHLPALRRRQPVGPALDLGCGTGTIGVVLSDLPVRPLVGIDLSSKMLNEARAKRVYAELRQDDIETALATYAAEEQSWALIISADALCYFGELEAVIRGAFAALQPGGLFVFSVEELPAPRSVPPSHGANENGTTGHGGHENGANDGANDGASRDATRDAATDKAWRLGPLGRYAHRADTLRALAVSAGFDILALRREVVRHDCGTMVHGLLVLLARPE